MKLTHTEEYESSVQELLALFTTRDYHRRKAVEARGARNFSFLEWLEGDQGFKVRLQYDADVELPEAFPERYKKHTKKVNTYIYTMEWYPGNSGHREGSMQIQIADMPLEVNGAMKLAPCPMGCQRTVDIAIDYHVPLVGKVISRVFAGSVKRSLAVEYAFNREMLARR